MQKKLLLVVVLFLNFLSPVYSSCNGTTTHPCLVQDTEQNSPQVKHWRDAPEMAATFQGNYKGLSQLWVSGSAAPSAQGWKTIVATIIKITENQVEKIIDIDLRQESHGYLNQNAITLAAKNDWANVGKSRDQVISDEKKWLQSLDHQKNLTVITPANFKADKLNHGNIVPVESVVSEEKTVDNAGIKYVRLTVTDHLAPQNADVDRFVALVRSIKPANNTWVHIHCRGGDGRTTMFMAMYDMMHNADKVPLADIIKRQAAVAPYYDLFDLSRKNQSFAKHYQQRKDFLTKFYQFSRASLRGYTGSWTEWLKR